MGDHEKFRDNIMNLNTRQFGKVGEVIVEILKDYVDSGDLKFDLVGADGQKVEVKASRVWKKGKLNITAGTFYKMIMSISVRDRLLSQSEAASGRVEFDCNIQQVKPRLFGRLVYLLFFKDQIEIFEVESDSLTSDTQGLGYSDKQHRGNMGEGQFHINQDTYQWHKSNNFVQSVSYSDLMREAKARANDTPE